MASSLDSRWAAHLKLLESDVKRIRNGSKLKQPLGFIIFLNNVSQQEHALALTWVQLQELKRQTLSEEPQPISENDKNLKAPTSEKSSCSLALSCDKDGASNLPRQFKSNEDFKDTYKKTVNLGQGESTDSIEEGRNKLWFREFPPDEKNISQSRFIPEEFLENIPEIPKEFKDSFRTVKHIVSACEKVSKLIAKEEKNDDPTDLLLKKIKWAQSLLDVWQLEHHDQMIVRQELWREEDWLDTLTAPLFKDRDEPNSLWYKLQSHLREAPSLDIPSFLKDFNSHVSINGQHSKVQNSKTITRRSKILTSFLNSSTLFLATFFTGKVLCLASPQSEPMVQKHGTLLGNLFEKKVFHALKDTISKRPRWITVFCGLVVLGNKQGKNEFDFLIILGQVKKIIYVECKYTLRENIAMKIKKQSNNAFEYLQEYLPVTKGWEFLTWACFEERASAPICSKCRPFLVPISDLETSFNKVLNERKNDAIENGTSKKDYEDLVKTYLFHALANKQVFEGSQVAKHQLKMVDFPSQSIILWNLDQLRILQKDPHRMIIKGFGRFGTGKTEILKTKAIKLAEDENTLVAFLVARPFFARRKSERLITKFLRFQLKPYKNIKVAEIQNGDFSTKGFFDAFFMDIAPETGNVRNLKIHIFIDEASRSNVTLLEDVLVNLPNDPDRFIWIVDSDEEEKYFSDSLSHRYTGINMIDNTEATEAEK